MAFHKDYFQVTRINTEVQKGNKENQNRLRTKTWGSKKIIKVLNSKNREELEQLGIQEKTKAILEVKRMHNKRNIMLQLHNKCQNLETSIQIFIRRCKY